jgi:hypothetical protein
MWTDKNDVYDTEPSVMETHIGRFQSGDAHDKTSRKQSGKPGCEPNADSPWIGGDSLLCKCLQCSSDRRCRIVQILGTMSVEVPSKKLVAAGPGQVAITCSPLRRACGVWPAEVENESFGRSIGSHVRQRLKRHSRSHLMRPCLEQLLLWQSDK